MFRNEHRWNLIFFLAWQVIQSLLHKEELSLIFSARKLICIGETSIPQLTACLLSEVNKCTAELSLGSSRNTSSRRAQISTEICINLFTRRRIKRLNRRRSFSISLNFYQTTVESSPQTRFISTWRNLILLIDALTFTPGETQDDPRRLRIAITLPEFRWIPKAAHYWLQQSRKDWCTVWSATLHYSTTQFVIVSLCCISLRHEINLLWRSFS